jgi:hypothetical protein
VVSAVVGEVRDRDPGSGRLFPADDPEVVVEIHLVDGLEGRRLRTRLTQVLREVSVWLARNSSNDGRQRAA